MPMRNYGSMWVISRWTCCALAVLVTKAELTQLKDLKRENAKLKGVSGF